MKVVFAGTPEVAVPSLDALVASSHEVVAVVTRPDARTGRGRRLEPSPVRRRAVIDAGFLNRRLSDGLGHTGAIECEAERAGDRAAAHHDHLELEHVRVRAGDGGRLTLAREFFCG